ncbi:hypothetical protein MIND_00654300 [Mycena indigotica]|uniref:Uncharacterized protein n=1 Tax=Mycena indigotica TaxID=2126181 RepID=A0A8H6SQK7_9AGAR|nr:uncharacterized protein MIND_00654300 [Mycena indigotica]KAF7304220.1 hypothetical protein MIND_00654300 [Mycena indigotica]
MRRKGRSRLACSLEFRANHGHATISLSAAMDWAMSRPGTQSNGIFTVFQPCSPSPKNSAISATYTIANVKYGGGFRSHRLCLGSSPATARSPSTFDILSMTILPPSALIHIFLQFHPPCHFPDDNSFENAGRGPDPSATNPAYPLVVISGSYCRHVLTLRGKKDTFVRAQSW